MNSNKKAEMGVGTLIIFIAMLLVAAVAAGVLIQTVGSLQSKAITVGSESEFQISTNAMTVEISAKNGSNAAVDDFEHILKLAPGSDPIKLTQATLSLSTLNSSTTYIYNPSATVCERNATAGFVVDTTNQNGTFAVFYLQRSPTWISGTMQKGDVIKLCYGAPYNITGDSNVRINFIPKVGTATLTDFVTPEVISTYRVFLFP